MAGQHPNSRRSLTIIPVATMSSKGYNFTMIETRYRLEYYLEDNGVSPFKEWLSNLRDRNGHAKISARLNRVKLGNFGVVKALGDGVNELKIDYGPGYRVYYAMSGRTVVLLLIGGDKSTQQEDIKAAKGYWKRQQRG